jgi:hypothetical protein
VENSSCRGGGIGRKLIPRRGRRLILGTFLARILRARSMAVRRGLELKGWLKRPLVQQLLALQSSLGGIVPDLCIFLGLDSNTTNPNLLRDNDATCRLFICLFEDDFISTTNNGTANESSFILPLLNQPFSEPKHHRYARSKRM